MEHTAAYARPPTTPSTEVLTERTIGRRLRIARKVSGHTQAAAAEAIGIARTTLVAIEQGRRRVRTRELQELAFLYGTSANAILRREAVHLDLVPQFRRLPQCADRGTDEAALLLNALVTAEVELENALGVERHRNHPRERRILPGDVRAQAEQDAFDLRVWLGLGAGPVKDIVSLVDLDLGIRVYLRPLDSRISGLFAYHDSVGACMLANARHPVGRRAYTVAHELGHFVSTRRKPRVLMRADTGAHSREERYADSFARSFLMPARALKQRFVELTAGHSHLTRRHVILLANCFSVSREAMVRRLEELELARHGTWDWFQAHGGITNRQAEEVLGASPDPENGASGRDYVPPRLALLVREAWKKAFYSEGQLARLLRLHRLEVRQLLEGVETEKREEDDVVKLPG